MDTQYAERYEDYQRWHWWFSGREQVLQAVLSARLPAKASRRIVSLGCGPAEGLLWLKPFAGLDGSTLGLDIRPSATVPGITTMVGSLDALPLASASFDLVLLLDVLEHLDDDTTALTKAARLLKPDGLLLATVPAMPSLWGAQDVVSHHRRRYTRRTFSDLFRRAGISRPSITYFNTVLFPPVAAIRWSRALLRRQENPTTDFEDNRPGVINDLCRTLFAFERHLVGRVTLPFGVSLLATASASSSR